MVVTGVYTNFAEDENSHLGCDGCGNLIEAKSAQCSVVVTWVWQFNGKKKAVNKYSVVVTRVWQFNGK